MGGLSYFADVAADDVELTEKVTLTRHFKDKVVQPILKVSLCCVLLCHVECQTYSKAGCDIFTPLCRCHKQYSLLSADTW